MKYIIFLFYITSYLPAIGQCFNQVEHTSRGKIVNDVYVNVTSQGFTSKTGYCENIQPYWIGSNNGNSASGSYAFHFSPPISKLSLNITGINNLPDGEEETEIYVNGKHYAIPRIATAKSRCIDKPAIVTKKGNLAGLPNSPGISFGAEGVVIDGLIRDIIVRDKVIRGTPNGAIFSLFICNGIKGIEVFDTSYTFAIKDQADSGKLKISTKTFYPEQQAIIYDFDGNKIAASENWERETFKIQSLIKGKYYIQIKNTKDPSLEMWDKFTVD